MPNLNGGMSALARVLGGGGEQQAFYRQAQMLGRMGLMQSQMRDNDAGVELKRAQAAKADQEAEQAKRQFDALQAPDLADTLIASMGLNAADPVQSARANELRGLVGLSRVLGKSSDFENLAKGLGVTQGTAQSGIAPQVAETNPEQAAWLLSSASGKGAPKIYDDMPMGTYNTLTGKRDYDQGLYQADLGLTGAKTGQANAAAGASKASAASSYASANLSNERAKSERDDRGGPNGKAPQGYRWTSSGLEFIPGGPADPQVKNSARDAAVKPIPPSALKAIGEDVDAVNSSSNINADLGRALEQIKAGKLDLGPISNKVGAALNWAGQSTESSRNLASFQATLERLRNESLRLSKGVQTEGDSQRAWNELVANINDPALVQQRLQEVMQINDRARAQRRMRIDQQRNNFGHEPMGDDQFTMTPAKPVASSGASGSWGGQSDGPKAGDVVDGYRFKGGRPGDPKSWEQVR